ncbi:hypothetical protein GF369_03865 [Candidatus Peregrinibacteria bacterium]|nr:hypothetical protein [Candidatus Peregrinibacteria bacterium]
MKCSTDIEAYLKEYAPDITIKPPAYTPEDLPEQYNAALLGKEQAEATQDMIDLIKEWITQPLIEDEAKSNTIRIQREKTFPPEVAEVLQNHKAHPKQITPALIALNVLIRNARKNNMEQLVTGYQEKLHEAAEWYNIFSQLRNQIYHIHNQVWEEVIPMFVPDEKEKFSNSPYEIINKKIAQQIEIIEHIAIEMLQKLQQ